MFWLTTTHLEAHAAVINAHVPQRTFDCADCRASRFRTAQPPNLEHAALNIGGVFTRNICLVKKDMRFEVGLTVLALAIAITTRVGNYSYDCAVPDNRASTINYFHG